MLEVVGDGEFDLLGEEDIFDRVDLQSNDNIKHGEDPVLFFGLS